MTMDESTQPPSTLKNCGPVGDRWLAEIGIRSVADLKRVGPVAAYRELKRLHPREVNLMALYAMVAGLMGIHVNDLPPDLKAQLKREASF